jgi:hypothetical protein
VSIVDKGFSVDDADGIMYLVMRKRRLDNCFSGFGTFVYITASQYISS